MAFCMTSCHARCRAFGMRSLPGPRSARSLLAGCRLASTSAPPACLHRQLLPLGVLDALHLVATRPTAPAEAEIAPAEVAGVPHVLTNRGAELSQPTGRLVDLYNMDVVHRQDRTQSQITVRSISYCERAHPSRSRSSYVVCELSSLLYCPSPISI